MPQPATTATSYLIVDDHKNMRQLLGALLPTGEKCVHEGRNGEEAVLLYARFRPDIVLMDVEMPVMGGVEATREIRLHHPQALVVMVTNHDDPLFKKLSLAAGATAFVSKSELQNLPSVLIDLESKLGHPR